MTRPMTAQRLTPMEAPNENLTEVDSIRAIREVLSTQEQAQAEPASKPRQARLRSVGTGQASAADAPAEPQAALQADQSVLGRKPERRAKWFQPTPGHLVLAGLVLAVVLYPLLVAAVLFFTVLFAIAGYLIAGCDGPWDGFVTLMRWYGRRFPKRAVALQASLDRFAMRWDAILDRFPEGIAHRFYLPDCSTLTEGAHLHSR